MSQHYDYGPLRTYQVTYKSGHIETVQGHQVIVPGMGVELPSIFGGTATKKDGMLTVHGEFDGHWRLMLAVRESLVESVKDVTGMDLWDQIEGRGGVDGGAE